METNPDIALVLLSPSRPIQTLLWPPNCYRVQTLKHLNILTKKTIKSFQEREVIPAADEEEQDTYGDEVLNAEEINEWKRKDIVARRILLSTIDKKLQITLVGCKTANEIMLRLSSQHAQKSTNNKYLLNKDFNDYEYNPGMKA